ncbi:MAG: tetratricopeptide repeat protein [Maricaulaceae bacterium]
MKTFGSINTPKKTKWLRDGAALALSTAMLGGCSIAKGYTKQEQSLVNQMDIGQYQPASREMRDNIATQNTLAQATFWSREYQLNPGDLESAIKLAASVRKMGNPGRAIEIAQTSRALYPRDPYLTAEYAAALVASERGDEAIKPLSDGLKITPQYARLWSLMGAALDQGENYVEARKYYERALNITPNDPNVLANMGLSYALSGDPQTAEKWLRQAVSIPGAGIGVKQNLALILDLQGKTPPASQANTSSSANYGQAQHNTWRKPSTPVIAPAPTQRPYQRAASTQSQTTQQYTPPTQPKMQAQNFQSASDAARAAIQQSQGRKAIISEGESVPSGSILTDIANSVGPKSAYGYNPYTHPTERLSMLQPSYPSQSSAAPQTAPSQPVYNAPTYTQPMQQQYVNPTPYSSPPQLRRGPARRR